MDDQILPQGKYKGKASGGARFAEVGDKKTPKVSIKLIVTDGPHTGEEVYWDGWLSIAAEAKTMESLRAFGWATDNIVDTFDLAHISGDVEFGVKHEMYQDRLQVKVAWVGKPGAGPSLDIAAINALSARFKGAAIASRQRVGGAASVAGRPIANEALKDSKVREAARAEVDALLAKAAALKAAAEAGFREREPGDDDDVPY